jgi:glycosidase
MSQYGNLDYHKQSGKMLAATLYFMWGTPFIYNGEEIGMTNADFTTLDQFQDVAIRRKYDELKDQYSDEQILRHLLVTSRDNSRTPMQWSNAIHGGFTNGEPWMKVNDNHLWLNVEQQLKDKNSILNFYKSVFKCRKEYATTILYGRFELFESALFAYERRGDERIVVISNFTTETLPFEHDLRVKQVLLANYSDANKESLILRPFETLVQEVDFD